MFFCWKDFVLKFGIFFLVVVVIKNSGYFDVVVYYYKVVSFCDDCFIGVKFNFNVLYFFIEDLKIYFVCIYG